MTKAELIDAIAGNADITKADAGKALDGFTTAVTNALAKGEDVVLVGFGTFTARERAARTGRNPATGEEIQIAASRTVGFKPGKALKDALN
jgi:DNA-binding protein HU-beta